MLRKSVYATILIFSGILITGCQQEGPKPAGPGTKGGSVSESQVTAPIPPDASPEQRKMQEYANQQAKAALERAQGGRGNR